MECSCGAARGPRVDVRSNTPDESQPLVPNSIEKKSVIINLNSVFLIWSLNFVFDIHLLGISETVLAERMKQL